MTKKRANTHIHLEIFQNYKNFYKNTTPAGIVFQTLKSFFCETNRC